MNYQSFSPDQKISPYLLGIEVTQDKSGHWSAWRDEKRIGGPFYNKPAFTKREIKGKGEILMVVNPYSDDPKFFVI